MSCWTTCCVTNQTNFTRKIHKIPNCPVRRGVDMRLTRIGALFDVKWFLPYTDDGRKIIIIKREIRIPNFVFLSSTKRGSRTTTLSAAFCSSSSIRVLVLCFYFFFFFSLRFALFFGTPIRSSSNNWINISNHRNFTIDRKHRTRKGGNGFSVHRFVGHNNWKTWKIENKTGRISLIDRNTRTFHHQRTNEAKKKKKKMSFFFSLKMGGADKLRTWEEEEVKHRGPASMSRINKAKSRDKTQTVWRDPRWGFVFRGEVEIGCTRSTRSVKLTSREFKDLSLSLSLL